MRGYSWDRTYSMATRIAASSASLRREPQGGPPGARLGSGPIPVECSTPVAFEISEQRLGLGITDDTYDQMNVIGHDRRRHQAPAAIGSGLFKLLDQDVSVLLPQPDWRTRELFLGGSMQSRDRCHNRDLWLVMLDAVRKPRFAEAGHRTTGIARQPLTISRPGQQPVSVICHLRFPKVCGERQGVSPPSLRNPLVNIS